MQKTSFALGDTEMHSRLCLRGPARRSACKSDRTGDCVHLNIFTSASACRFAVSVLRCVHPNNGIWVFYEYFRSNGYRFLWSISYGVSHFQCEVFFENEGMPWLSQR